MEPDFPILEESCPKRWSGHLPGVIESAVLTRPSIIHHGMRKLFDIVKSCVWHRVDTASGGVFVPLQRGTGLFVASKHFVLDTCMNWSWGQGLPRYVYMLICFGRYCALIVYRDTWHAGSIVAVGVSVIVGPKHETAFPWSALFIYHRVIVGCDCALTGSLRTCWTTPMILTKKTTR